MEIDKGKWKRYLWIFQEIIAVLLEFIYLLVFVRFIPTKRKRYIQELFTKGQYEKTNIRKEDIDNTVFSIEAFRAKFLQFWRIKRLQTVKLGSSVENVILYTLEGKPERLVDYLSNDKPLVINFGSTTAPNFVSSLQCEFPDLIKEYREISNFLIVYVMEAHPTDGWYFPSSFKDKVSYQKSLQERIDTVLENRGQLYCPLLVDDIHDKAAQTYGVCECCIIVLQNGKCVFTTGCGPLYYRIEKLKNWLDSYACW